jgi:hypothetical protein
VTLFKSADEEMGLGNDRVLRGEFPQAVDRYQEAAKKYAKMGNLSAATVANAYLALARLGVTGRSAAGLQAAANAVAPLGGMALKLGPREWPASSLAREAQLLAEEETLQGQTPQDPTAHAALAQRFQALSLAYRQMGNVVLVIPETFWHTTESASLKAPYMAALSEEEMGESLVSTDPKRAAEHNQNARNWWMQAGKPDRAEGAEQRGARYGRAVRCWFCGREVTGEGVQFVSLSSEMGAWNSADRGSALPSVNLPANSVYVCKGCQSTVDKVADERATQRANEVRVELQAQIDELKRRMPLHP